MRLTPVRHLNDGLELVRFRNVIRGFEVFTLRVKDESLVRTVRSHCFKECVVTLSETNRLRPV